MQVNQLSNTIWGLITVWALILLNVFICLSPSGMGRGTGRSRDLGISKAGGGMDEVFSMPGKGDSLLLETLAVWPSSEWPGMGLLHRGRLGQLPKDTPSTEPHGFTWGEKRVNKRVREVEVDDIIDRVTVKVIWHRDSRQSSYLQGWYWVVEDWQARHR